MGKIPYDDRGSVQLFPYRGKQTPPACQRIQRGMCRDERKPYAYQEKEI